MPPPQVPLLRRDGQVRRAALVDRGLSVLDGRAVRAHLALRAGQTMPTLAYEVTIRRPSAVEIKAGMLVVHGARAYRVQTVFDPDLSGRELKLLCVEAPAPGA